jgi:hypothetical protein
LRQAIESVIIYPDGRGRWDAVIGEIIVRFKGDGSGIGALSWSQPGDSAKGTAAAVAATGTAR